MDIALSPAIKSFSALPLILKRYTGYLVSTKGVGSAGSIENAPKEGKLSL